jgi:ABC-type transport system involved in Fe-S cluster assembly fused permease/ATPase subunit
LTSIFVLERGRIIESGKHEQLLNEKGLYYPMTADRGEEHGGMA